jgi:hypothetical protein
MLCWVINRKPELYNYDINRPGATDPTSEAMTRDLTSGTLTRLL